MLVHLFPYETYFYNQLIDTYSDNELTPQERSTVKKRSALIWDIARKLVDEKTKISKSIPVTEYTFIGNAGFPSRIFYRIKCELNAEKNIAQVVDVNDNLMFNAFNYIGITMPDGIDDKYLIDKRLRVRVLYQLFLEKNCYSFLKLNPDLVVYEPTATIVENNNLEVDFLSKEVFPLVDEEVNRNEAGDEQRNIHSLKSFIDKYFYTVNKSMGCSDLWQFFTPNMKLEDWNSDYCKYLLGFSDIIRKDEHHAFNFCKLDLEQLEVEVRKPKLAYKFKIYYKLIVRPRAAKVYRKIHEALYSALDEDGKTLLMNELDSEFNISKSDYFDFEERLKAYREYFDFRDFWIDDGRPINFLRDETGLGYHKLQEWMCVLSDDYWYINSISKLNTKDFIKLYNT